MILKFFKWREKEMALVIPCYAWYNSMENIQIGPHNWEQCSNIEYFISKNNDSKW